MNNIKNKEMFLMMRNIFYGGEFSHWLADKEIPWGAYKEYEEAKEFFEKETGFSCSEAEKMRDMQDD